MIRAACRVLILAATLMMGKGGEAMSADILLIDDFDGQDFAESGGLYYKKNLEQIAGAVEFQDTVTHRGRGALKMTIRPRCPPPQGRCSERAEIWEKPELRVPYHVGVWYGFAVKFGDPVPSDDHRYVIAQWKREIDPGAPGDFSPFLALRLKRGKLFATVETNYSPGFPPGAGSGEAGCDSPGTPVWLRPDTNQMRALVATSPGWEREDGVLFNDHCTDKITVVNRGNDLPSPESGWIDFAVYSKPGPDGSGHIEIFANDKWIVTVKGAIGHNDPPLGKNQYFKFGPYRAAHTTTWTMYYDNFRRSPNCADVLGNVPCPF
jgi:hypothetical protein